MKKDSVLFLASFMFIVLMLLGMIYVEILYINKLEIKKQELITIKEKVKNLNDKYENFNNTKTEVDKLNEEKKYLLDTNNKLKESISNYNY